MGTWKIFTNLKVYKKIKIQDVKCNHTGPWKYKNTI
jgi:hypothetical protein